MHPSHALHTCPSARSPAPRPLALDLKAGCVLAEKCFELGNKGAVARWMFLFALTGS
jgi:hypothetical protein